jgi:hypothetical protein
MRNIEVVDGWLVESGREHLGCRDNGVGGGDRRWDETE